MNNFRVCYVAYNILYGLVRAMAASVPQEPTDSTNNESKGEKDSQRSLTTVSYLKIMHL